MTNPLGAADFFALEAGECLDRLEVLITQPDGPKPAELLRYARALRGSALMANQGAIARAAAGFEGLARAIRDRGRPWDAIARERSAHAVDELRHLVRRAREWNEGDSQRAARVAGDLDALAGSSSGDTLRPAAASAPGTINTGVRAFVAREGALIASALDRAARSIETTPEAREPLYAVLRRMQSLRGLAEIADLTPLPEILDGIELAVGDLTRLFAPPPGVTALLDAAAAALTRVSRDVADQGRPEADPEEARRFTEELLRAFATESDVVSIESLYPAAEPEPMQRSTAQPQFSPPAPLGPVELVGYGEHLTQAADRVTSPGSGTARDLRLYALVSTLRSVAIPGHDPVTPALARFGRAARGAIGTGRAARLPDEFGACLREAGRVLSGLAEGADEGDAGSRIHAIAQRLDALGREPTAAPVAAPPAGVALAAESPAPAAAAAPVAAGEEALPPEPVSARGAPAEVVPIESLAFDGESVFAARGPTVGAPADLVVPIESLELSDRAPLERAFDTYRRLTRAERLPTPATAISGVVPEAAPVDVRILCYSGRSALERASQVRSEITEMLARSGDFASVEPLFRELLDLVPLALDAAH